MRSFFLAVFLFSSGHLMSQENLNYDPDFDDNGCYTVFDILAFLVILMPDEAGMDSPNPTYDPDYDGNGELTILDLTGMLTWFGECEAPSNELPEDPETGDFSGGSPGTPAEGEN